MTEAVLLPRAAPLFTIELGANGGRLAAVSMPELVKWLQKELENWAWLGHNNRGNHEQGFRHAVGQLNQALNNAVQSQQYKSSNPSQAAHSLEASRTQIHEAFVTRKLPHSSAPLAQRIQAYQKEAGANAASFLLAVHIPPDHAQFQPIELSAWRGLVEGLIERFQLTSASARSRKQAVDQSFEQLRIKAEQLVADKTETYYALHRDYADLAESVRTTATAQLSEFATAQSARGLAFDDLLNQHEDAMARQSKA